MFVPTQFSGGLTERVTPVPIPNTEVKPLWADGTARAIVWETRSLPGLNQKPRCAAKRIGAFCFWLNYFVFVKERLFEKNGRTRVSMRSGTRLV